MIDIVPARGRWINPLAVFIVMLAARLVVATTFPTEWDSVLLLQGVEHFDVSRMAPHPPGYYLYVKAGWLLSAVSPLSAEASLVLISALASAGAACLSFLIGRHLRNGWFGWTMAVVVGASPVIAFYGSIIATYSFDLLIGFALIYTGMRARRNQRFVIVATVIVAIGAGFRSSSLLFNAPLLLAIVLFARPQLRTVGMSAAAGGLALGAWFVPMIAEQPGGFSQWRLQSRAILDGAFGTTAWWRASREQAVDNVKTATAYAVVAFAPFLPAVLLALCGRVAGRIRIHREELILAVFAGAQMFPAALFVTFGHWGKAGYLLMFAAGGFVLVAVAIARVPTAVAVVASVLLIAGSGLGLQRYAVGNGVLPQQWMNSGPWFTERSSWAPFPETLPQRHRLEREMSHAIRLIQDVHPEPGKDVIALLDGNGGHRFAHVAWAFPDMNVSYIAGDGIAYEARDGLWNQAEKPSMIVRPNGGRVYAIFVNTPEEVSTAELRNQGTPRGAAPEMVLWELGDGARIAGVEVVSSADAHA